MLIFSILFIVEKRKKRKKEKNKKFKLKIRKEQRIVLNVKKCEEILNLFSQKLSQFTKIKEKKQRKKQEKIVKKFLKI